VKHGSLRVRLLLGAAAAMLVAVAISWLALTVLFERHIERQVLADLTREAHQLVAGLSVDESGRAVVTAHPEDSRFNQPAGGKYWQLVSDSGLSQRSSSLWDQSLPAPSRSATSEWRARTASGPFEQELLLLERTVQPERASPRVLVQLAQDRAAIDAARDAFGRELVLYLFVLWVVLALAAWAQVHLGLQPLKRLHAELATLFTSASARLTGRHPAEVQPLTDAINALADARERDLQAARRRAADLAHGLKTPLAALAAQSRRARDAGAASAADGLDHAISAARVAVEAELARSRVAHARGANSAETPVAAAVERVVAVLERTDFGADRVFETHVPAELTVPLVPEDLAELLGALIENAARHARRRVRVSGMLTPNRADTGSNAERCLTVEDDGPGLDTASVSTALLRGARLDESGPGHGLGLSIAHELMLATGGTLSIDTGELGGLRATARWNAGKRTTAVEAAAT
jgi:signal transduction histidine kinase